MKKNWSFLIFLIIFSLLLGFILDSKQVIAKNFENKEVSGDNLNTEGKLNIINNLASDPSFENSDLNANSPWKIYDYQNKSEVTKIFYATDRVHSGKRSLKIESYSNNDARIMQNIAVEKNSYYKLTAWVWAKSIGPQTKGANISISGILDTSEEIKDSTDDWTLLELYGQTNDNQKDILITVGLGGYSSENKGFLWIDDVSVEKIDFVPLGKRIIKMYHEDFSEEHSSQDVENNESSDRSHEGYGHTILYYYIIFCLILIISYFMIIKNKWEISLNNSRIIAIILLVLGLIVRMVIAPIIEGFPNDMACFKGWSDQSYKMGFKFYTSDGFCDYPPVYILVLGILGFIQNIFPMINLTLLIKMPPILCDCILAYLAYKYSLKNNIKNIFSVLLMTAVLFNPVVILDSAIWGMMDSFLALLIIIALIMINNNNLGASAILITLAILTKPQGLFFAPILIYEVIKRRDVKAFFRLGLIVFGSVFFVIAPYAIYHNRGLLWIVDLYVKTAEGYQFASFNAFNFYAMLGLNTVSDSDLFLGISYATIGLGFSVIILCVGYYFYSMSNHKSLVFLMAAFMNMALFMFTTRMHERYMYFLVIFLVFAIVHLYDKRLYIVFFGFSGTILYNIHIVLFKMLKFDYPHIDRKDSAMILISAINVLLTIFFVYLLFKILERKDFYVDNSIKVKKGD